jgi:hypothetical protein
MLADVRIGALVNKQVGRLLLQACWVRGRGEMVVVVMPNLQHEANERSLACHVRINSLCQPRQTIDQSYPSIH